MKRRMSCPWPSFFKDTAEDVLMRWELHAEKDSAARRMSLQALHEGLALPGQALHLDPAVGFISLISRPSTVLMDIGSRIHLRAHFFDHGQEHPYLGHWLGLKSRLGSGSLGLAFGIEGSYSCLNGDVASCASGRHYGWLRVSDRSRGWHLLELIIEEGELSAIIDGEPLLTTKAEGFCETEEVWLVSRSGGPGIWAGVELFHTPPGNRRWETGAQSVQPGELSPWDCLTEEGRWQLDDAGVMRSIDFRIGTLAKVTAVKQRLLDSFSRVSSKYPYKSGMDQMLGKEYRVVKIADDGMVGLPSPDGSDDGVWWFPPYAYAIRVVTEEPPKAETPEPGPVAPAPVDEEVHVPEAPQMDEEEEQPEGGTAAPVDFDGFTLDCWNIPGEEDIKRIERCVSTFVNALAAANVALPENIARVQLCAAHPGCHVYKFGTRRVHMATRAGEGGRLLLVVRVGGGYMDFIEFARRNGSLEQLRLQKTSEPGKREVARFTSVLSKGRRKTIPSKT
mmetsp:Transcript_76926/g.135547  ORF Transcript_76926/g.135547 Transcript_76926/m.135547 type:complete len:506 (-) Transcript_76926:144-1661(-)